MRKEELYEDIYDKQFSFGKNWKKYLRSLNTKKIELAKTSLSKFTKLKSFEKKTFLDVGCGSGLFSLAALKLGAKSVTSVDVDESSLNCAKYLRKKFKISKTRWKVKKLSALDTKEIKKLEKFDIVYSWGVLHHTGQMKKALKNVTFAMKKDSLLYIAIYNDFRGLPINSKTWVKIKRFYSKRGKCIRKVMEWTYTIYTVLGLLAFGRNPITYIKNYDKKAARGMNFFRDIEDWLGGYPYEYASVKNITLFYKKLGLQRINLIETKREGCNEFLFRR